MGKYFTEYERYQFEILLKDNIPLKEISILLNKSLATIYNERKRGLIKLRNSDYTEYEIYQADVAQRKYNEKKIDKGRPYKVSNDLQFIKFVEKKIMDDKYSPCAVLAEIKNKRIFFKTNICFKTLYNYINNGVFLGLGKESLPMPRKGRKRANMAVCVDVNNLRGRSIETRTDAINKRYNFGHWEMDTVVSGDSKKSALLVMTERFSRFEKIFKIPDKTTNTICSVLNGLEEKLGTDKFCKIFKSITMDNGSEFKNFVGIEKSCISCGKRTITYFCHPYSSWERGSNENNNRLIRRWIMKGADISKYDDEFIMNIEKWINSYPRKIFDYCCSLDIIKNLGYEYI